MLIHFFKVNFYPDEKKNIYQYYFLYYFLQSEVKVKLYKLNFYMYLLHHPYVKTEATAGTNWQGTVRKLVHKKSLISIQNVCVKV